MSRTSTLRWVTSGTIPFDPWHRETHIGLTLCGRPLNLEDMLTSLGEPVRRCPTCVTLSRLDPDENEKELTPA